MWGRRGLAVWQGVDRVGQVFCLLLRDSEEYNPEDLPGPAGTPLRPAHRPAPARPAPARPAGKRFMYKHTIPLLQFRIILPVVQENYLKLR